MYIYIYIYIYMFAYIYIYIKMCASVCMYIPLRNPRRKALKPWTDRRFHVHVDRMGPNAHPDLKDCKEP